MLRFGMVIGIGVAAVLGTALPATGEDWPQWRGPRRDGTSREKGLSRDWAKRPPRQLWKANVGTGFASVAVSKGLAVTLGNRRGTDTVYAFDAAGGEVKWKHSYPCPVGALRHEGGPYATPTIDGDRVYTLGKAGRLLCLDVADGRVVWQKNVARETGTKAPSYGFAGSPLVSGKLLILNVGSAGAALDKATGRVVWKSDGEGTAGHASPRAVEIAGRRAVAILAESQLVGVNPADGRVLWRHELPSGSRAYKIADPVFLGQTVLITATYRNLCLLLRIADGGVREVWRNRSLLSKVFSPIVVDGHVVCGHLEKTLRCVEPASGKVTWEQPFAGSAILVDGLCLVLSAGGELILAEVGAKAFKELARKRILDGKCWTAPALAGGRLYCRNAAGDVVCVEVGGK